jgi:hypothetical protein
MSSTIDLTRGLGKTLLVWSVASFIFGIITFFIPNSLIQGIGLQAILWGIIDGIIAGFALLNQKDDSAEKFARILKINVGLDVVYQIVGVLLILFAGADLYMTGNGIGVIIQGAFLFILDFFYWTRMKQLILQ